MVKNMKIMNIFKNKNLLITGGNGSFGKELINYLKISKFYRRGLHMINNLNNINWEK